MRVDNQIIDSHCHLDFLDEDEGIVIKRAEEAGVGSMLTIGTSLNATEK